MVHSLNFAEMVLTEPCLKSLACFQDMRVARDGLPLSRNPAPSASTVPSSALLGGSGIRGTILQILAAKAGIALPMETGFHAAHVEHWEGTGEPEIWRRADQLTAGPAPIRSGGSFLSTVDEIRSSPLILN